MARFGGSFTGVSRLVDEASCCCLSTTEHTFSMNIYMHISNGHRLVGPDETVIQEKPAQMSHKLSCIDTQQRLQLQSADSEHLTTLYNQNLLFSTVKIIRQLLDAYRYPPMYINDVTLRAIYESSGSGLPFPGKTVHGMANDALYVYGRIKMNYFNLFNSLSLNK